MLVKIDLSLLLIQGLLFLAFSLILVKIFIPVWEFNVVKLLIRLLLVRVLYLDSKHFIG